MRWTEDPAGVSGEAGAAGVMRLRRFWKSWKHNLAADERWMSLI